MGITGLIPFLEKASSKVNLKDLKGCTVAVDTYCWLHKGVYSCADQLARGEDTDVYIQYCLKYIQMLLSFDIKPILVFDGQHLPAKSLTEQRRREQRREAKKKGVELLRLGKIQEARSQFRRCIDITHEMALKLIKECRRQNIDCIVAPYEADAQMAWLNKVDLAQYVITEDSDLTLFGAKKIIFKLDLFGNGLLIESDKLYMAMGCRQEKYSFNKFRRMCILSGCDYLDSLPGIGLAKACKFMLMTEEDDMWKALKKIPQYLKMKNLEVDTSYIENFLKAEATFRHMYVYNPLKRQMERLYELKEFETDEKFCSNAGVKLDDDAKAFQLALGNLNPLSLKQLDNWNPDDLKQWPQQEQPAKNKHIKRSKHMSIWLCDDIARINKSSSQTSRPENKGALFFKKIDFNSKYIEEEIEQKIAEENAKPHEAEVFSLYKFGVQQNSAVAKRKRSSSEDEDVKRVPVSPVINKSRHNPFAKIQSDQNEIDLQKSPKVCENSSLLRVLSPKKSSENSVQSNNSKLKNLRRNIFLQETEKKVEVKSRFFASNIKKVTQKTTLSSFAIKSPSSNQSPTQTTPPTSNISEEIVKIENDSQIKQEQQMLLYQSPSPVKKIKKSNDFVPLSHTDSGLGSIASDTLYQTDVLSQEDESASSQRQLFLKQEIKTEENELETNNVGSDKDEAIVLSDTDSVESSQPSSEVIKKIPNSFAFKSKTPSRVGLSKVKSKGSSKLKPIKSLSLDLQQNQMKLSAFGFQKRPVLK